MTPPPRSSCATSPVCASDGAPAIAHRFTFGTFEQLARVRDGRCCDLFAAEHAGDLFDALLGVIEASNARARLCGGVFLPHEEVRRGEAGNLRKMGDANDLIALRQ